MKDKTYNHIENIKIVLLYRKSVRQFVPPSLSAVFSPFSLSPFPSRRRSVSVCPVVRDVDLLVVSLNLSSICPFVRL